MTTTTALPHSYSSLGIIYAHAGHPKSLARQATQPPTATVKSRSARADLGMRELRRDGLQALTPLSACG